MRLIVANIQATGGGSGKTVLSAARLPIDTRITGTYWLALFVAVGSILLVYFLLRSRSGLALTAIRDNDLAAQSSGVNVFRSKLFVYVIAAFGCGVIGAVVAMNLLRIQPAAAFSINWTAYAHVHRGDRRVRHHRGPDHRGRHLLRAAADPQPVRHARTCCCWASSP